MSILYTTLLFCQLYGQEGRSRIKGIIVEGESQEPVIQAVIELLNAKDSTRLDAAVSDLDGRFSIITPPGSYILKFSMLGMEEQTRSISITQTHQDNFIGTIRMEPESMVLETARTVAKIPPVTIVEDTVTYNAAAYRVDDDASVAELLKKIPGLEIQGKSITLHGKPVSKMLISGKEAFGDDIISGLKNMPAEMIEKVKTYEKETEEARISGVDDGEEITVIDLSVKKTFFDGWHSNASGGYGTKGRYSGRYSTNKLTDDKQIAAVANIGNENESGLSSETNRNRLGSGNAGESTEGSLGLSFAKNNDHIESSGNIRYTGSNKDALGNQFSESILKTSSSYSSTIIDEIYDSDDLNVNYNIQIKSSPKNTILIKPSASFSKSRTERTSEGTAFSDEGYSIPINASNNLTCNETGKIRAALTSQFSHRINNKGRTFSIYINGSYYGNNTTQYQDYHTFYYKKGDTTHKETDNLVDSRSSSLTMSLTYNEPFSKTMGLQSSVALYYRHESRERIANDLQDPSYDEYANNTYNYHGIKWTEGLRYSKKKIYTIAGFSLMSQWSALPDKDIKIHTNVVNASPFIRINFNRSKTEKFKFLYTGQPSIPSLYYLSPDVNRTNPLYIRSGNPYLKPSFSQNATLSYNSSNIAKQSCFICSAQFNTVNNAVSTSTVYDDETGIRTSTPQNINGNWSASGSAVWNRSLKDSKFSFSNHTWIEYKNNMAYLYDSQNKVDEINQTTRFLFREKGELCWRSNWMELVLNATSEYTDERSMLRPVMDQRPYFFSFGFAPAANMPWKMRLSSNFDFLCQRGYTNEDLNRNFLLWNATISQTLLMGRMTARLTAYDILGQQCNMLRNFTAERRTTTTYNGIHRYVILRVLWRF